MGKKNINRIHTRDIASLYSDTSMIDSFRRALDFLVLTWGGCDIGACLAIEKANINTVGETFIPYFYFHLHIIHELGVLISFTPFPNYPKHMEHVKGFPNNLL